MDEIKLTPLEEVQYLEWKKKNAPNLPDSNSLRSAFKEAYGDAIGSDINPIRAKLNETPTFADVVNESAKNGNAIDNALLKMGEVSKGQPMTSQEVVSNLGAFLDNPRITQRFGAKTFDFYGPSGHEGVDYGAAVGTPLHGLKGWVVESAGKGASYYGNTITLKNPSTGEKIEFAHLNDINVKPGEVIYDDKQVIGTTGASGSRPDNQPQQAHLHVNYYDKNGVRSDVTSLAENTKTKPKTVQASAAAASANFPVVPTATQAVKTAQTKVQQPATFISANKDPAYNGNGYLIKPGDSLSKIAKDLGTTVGTLMAKNNLTSPNKIYSGDVIRY